MTRESRLTVVFALNGVLILALIGVGLGAHSLSVFAAAGDYLADAVAIGLALLTLRLARRVPTAKRSFGYERATILAAQANASLIVAVAVLVCFEAIRRLVAGIGQVHGLPVVVVSTAAAVVMLTGALVLRGGARGDLNMRAVLLDTAADAVTATGVALTGAIILVTGRLYWLDPAVALAVALVIGYRALALLREVGDILLESTPAGIELPDVGAAICAGGDIEGVHDLHVWSLSSAAVLLSAHVVLAGHPSLEEAQATVEGAKRRLVEHFGIEHATLEMECEPCAVPDLHAGRRA
jgi:cobalt-zinc-cadmium efflux system protein